MLARYPPRGSQPLLLPLLAVFGAGLCRAISRVRSARRPALYVHRRPRHHMALLDHAILRRPRRRGGNLLGVSALRRARGGRGDRDGRAARIPSRSTRSNTGARPVRSFCRASSPDTSSFRADCVRRSRVARQRSLRVLAWSALALGLVALVLSVFARGLDGIRGRRRVLGGRADASRRRAGRRRSSSSPASRWCCCSSTRITIRAKITRACRSGRPRCRSSIDFRSPASGRSIFRGSTRSCARPTAIRRAFHAHSLYLTFFAEFGIVGVARVAWTIWRFAVELRRRLAQRAARAGVFGAERDGGTGRRRRARAHRYRERGDFRTMDADDGASRSPRRRAANPGPAPADNAMRSAAA